MLKLARAIGGGRLMVGAVILASPDSALRVLGLDSATAKRVRFLTQMAAARDMGMGAGTLASTGRGRRSWLLAGAAVDTGDAVAIARALRAGQVRGPAAQATVVVAAAAAAAGCLAAARGGRRIS